MSAPSGTSLAVVALKWVGAVLVVALAVAAGLTYLFYLILFRILGAMLSRRRVRRVRIVHRGLLRPWRWL